MPKLQSLEQQQRKFGIASPSAQPSSHSTAAGTEADLFQEFSDLLEKVSKRVSSGNGELAELLKIPSLDKPVRPEPHKQDVASERSANATPTDTARSAEEQLSAESTEAEQTPKEEERADTSDAESETKTEAVSSGEVKDSEESSQAAAQAAAATVPGEKISQEIKSEEMQSPELMQSGQPSLPQEQAQPDSDAALKPFVESAKSEQVVSAELKLDQQTIKEGVAVKEKAAEPLQVAPAVSEPADGAKVAEAVLPEPEQSAASQTQLRQAKLEAELEVKVKNSAKSGEGSLLPAGEQIALRGQDAALHSVLLRGMLDGLRAKGNEVAAPQASQNTFQLMSGSAVSSRAERQRLPESLRPRNIPLPDQQRALEKVQQAVKDASQSKDGKSISLRLDPPNLGRVKIDVSLRDGVLHARIVPELSQVSYLLRERAHELQSNLRKLGIEAEQIQVSIGSEGSSEGSTLDSSFSSGSEQSGYELEKGNFGSAFAAQLQDPSAGKAKSALTLDHWVA